MPAPRSIKASSGTGSLFAVLLMVGAMLIVPLMDIIAKYLSSTIPPLEVSFGRFLFQLLISVAAALALGQSANLIGRYFWINALRGVLLSLAVLCFFTAVKYMSVATAISIFFVEPMILTILAVVLLGERVGPRRIAAVLIGLAGALIILRPSIAEIGPVSLLPLGTAVFFALYVLINRIHRTPGSLLAIQFGAGLSGAVLLGTALFIGTAMNLSGFAFVAPSGIEVLFLFAIGLISFIAHGMVVVAFQRGEASLLAPLQYIEIVSATVFGYLVFSDFPDAMTWAGIALIVASGIYITYRERAASKTGAS